MQALADSVPADPPPVLPRVAAGDPAAVSLCLDRYGGLVWSVARRACSCEADAEDVTQETFMSLWRSAGRYDASAGSEAAFVTTIARRRLADYLRRKPTVAADVTADLVAPSSDREPDDADAAREALSELKDDQRRVVDLSIFGGLSYAEIGRRLGMPASTAKSHATRAIAVLRDRLERRRQALRIRRQQYRLQPEGQR
jgi:RNA polymerase sigma-70 factor (ECF subfamily)